MIVRRIVQMNHIHLELDIETEFSPQKFPIELPVIQRIMVRNFTCQPLKRAYLRFCTEPAALIPHCIHLPELQTGETFETGVILPPVYQEMLGRRGQDLTVTLKAELILLTRICPPPDGIDGQMDVLAEHSEEILIRQNWGRDICDFYARRDQNNGRFAVRGKKPSVPENAMRKEFCGYPSREIIDTWRSTLPYENIVSFGGLMLGKDEAFFRDQRAAVEALISAAKTVGHPHGHPLARIRQTDLQTAGRLRGPVLDIIPELEQLLKEMVHCGSELAESLSLPLKCREDWQKLHELSERTEWLKTVFPELADMADPQKAVQDLEEYLWEAGRAELIRKDLLQRWNESFLLLEADAFDWLTHPLLPFARIRFFRDHARCEKAAETVRRDYDLLNIYRALMRRTEQLIIDFPEEIRQRILAGEGKEISVMLHLLCREKDGETVRKLTDPMIREKALLFGSMADAFSRRRRLLEEWLDPAPIQKSDLIQDELLLYRAVNCPENELLSWINWNKACAQASRYGLRELVERYRDGLDHEAAMPSYLHALCNELLTSIAQDPMMGMLLPELLYG